MKIHFEMLRKLTVPVLVLLVAASVLTFAVTTPAQKNTNAGYYFVYVVHADSQGAVTQYDRVSNIFYTELSIVEIYTKIRPILGGYKGLLQGWGPFSTVAFAKARFDQLGHKPLPTYQVPDPLR